MSKEEVFCIWIMGEEYFGIPISKVASLHRAHIKMEDLGRSISGEFLGEALPGGVLVHAPIYFSEDTYQKMHQGSHAGRQVVLLSNRSEHVALIAERVLFVGLVSDFKESTAPINFISPEDYFVNKGDVVEEQNHVAQESLESAEKLLDLLKFKINNETYEMSVDDVVKVYSPKDLIRYHLLCDEAEGYVFGGHNTIPVINLGADLTRHSSRVLVLKSGGVEVGVAVDDVSEVSRSQRGVPHKLDLEGRFGSQLLSDLCHAYTKVFPSPARTLAESQKKASLMYLLKVDIGEVVFVPISSVVSIQPAADTDISASTFNYQDVEMPLVYLPTYYGFQESSAEHHHRRVLIAEQDGVRLALVVDAVLEILQVDRESENQVLKWCLNNYSEKFQADARGIINVADYRKNTFLNLIYLSFTSLLGNKAA
ncbi:chemotaxis protein CheW [Bdellovibrio sp. HCB209]|uniref:chemotaxis protein CheW n=1 Tax=Bdellovibrio sp. HCB209 TaxID=3394354 RepID=UPI0039B3C15D